MNEIFWVIFCVITIIIGFSLVMYRVLVRQDIMRKDSVFILNAFEPDNTAPMITEMINFHREEGNIKYIIGDKTDER